MQHVVTALKLYATYSSLFRKPKTSRTPWKTLFLPQGSHKPLFSSTFTILRKAPRALMQTPLYGECFLGFYGTYGRQETLFFLNGINSPQRASRAKSKKIPKSGLQSSKLKLKLQTPQQPSMPNGRSLHHEVSNATLDPLGRATFNTVELHGSYVTTMVILCYTAADHTLGWCLPFCMTSSVFIGLLREWLT